MSAQAASLAVPATGTSNGANGTAALTGTAQPQQQQNAAVGSGTTMMTTTTTTTTTTSTPSAYMKSLLEEHITAVLRDAASVQRHAKRARLHPTAKGGMCTRRRLHAADVNLALQLRGVEPLYGTGVSALSTDDTILDLNDLIKQSAHNTRPPSEVAASMHWLAVKGQIPEIPQNVTTTAAVSTKAGGARSTVANNSNNPLLVQQLQTAVLAEELQLYFGRVTMALEHGTSTAQATALRSLAMDKGLQELVPFLIRYSQQALFQQVPFALSVIQMTLSLLHNPHLHLELHIHELLPALLTCIVTTTATKSKRDHWAIRQWASLALVAACQLFQEEYITLQARVLQVLCQALQPGKPLPSVYGGLIALRQFGPKAVDAFCLDLILHYYWPRWQKEASQDNNPDEEALLLCQQAALEALHVYFQGVTTAEQANRASSIAADGEVEIADWCDVLGDAATPLVVLAEEHQFPYATTFV